MTGPYLDIDEKEKGKAVWLSVGLQEPERKMRQGDKTDVQKRYVNSPARRSIGGSRCRGRSRGVGVGAVGCVGTAGLHILKTFVIGGSVLAKCQDWMIKRRSRIGKMWGTYDEEIDMTNDTLGQIAVDNVVQVPVGHGTI